MVMIHHWALIAALLAAALAKCGDQSEVPRVKVSRRRDELSDDDVEEEDQFPTRRRMVIPGFSAGVVPLDNPRVDHGGNDSDSELNVSESSSGVHKPGLLIAPNDDTNSDYPSMQVGAVSAESFDGTIHTSEERKDREEDTLLHAPHDRLRSPFDFAALHLPHLPDDFFEITVDMGERRNDTQSASHIRESDKARITPIVSDADVPYMQDARLAALQSAYEAVVLGNSYSDSAIVVGTVHYVSKSLAVEIVRHMGQYSAQALATIASAICVLRPADRLASAEAIDVPESHVLLPEVAAVLDLYALWPQAVASASGSREALIQLGHSASWAGALSGLSFLNPQYAASRDPLLSTPLPNLEEGMSYGDLANAASIPTHFQPVHGRSPTPYASIYATERADRETTRPDSRSPGATSRPGSRLTRAPRHHSLDAVREATHLDENGPADASYGVGGNSSFEEAASVRSVDAGVRISPRAVALTYDGGPQAHGLDLRLLVQTSGALPLFSFADVALLWAHTRTLSQIWAIPEERPERAAAAQAFFGWGRHTHERLVGPLLARLHGSDNPVLVYFFRRLLAAHQVGRLTSSSLAETYVSAGLRPGDAAHLLRLLRAALPLMASRADSCASLETGRDSPAILPAYAFAEVHDDYDYPGAELTSAYAGASGSGEPLLLRLSPQPSDSPVSVFDELGAHGPSRVGGPSEARLSLCQAYIALAVFWRQADASGGSARVTESSYATALVSLCDLWHQTALAEHELEPEWAAEAFEDEFAADPHPLDESTY